MLGFLKKKKYRCSLCHSDLVKYEKVKSALDFNPNLFDKKIAFKLKNKINGICEVCGISQNFNKLNLDELKTFNLINKDHLTSEKNFSTYPPKSDFLKSFNNTYFKKRLRNWDNFFGENNFNLKRILILRYWFGNSVDFLKKKFNAKIYGMELSSNCKKYVQDNSIQLIDIPGEINGIFEIKKKIDTKFDAIFCFHLLIHSIDINRSILKLKSLLGNKGIIVFSNEIEKKQLNPFHNYYFSETQFYTVLQKHFSKIIRIDDCQSAYVNHVNPFTIKNDIPDIVVFN
tara:strand:- start:19320 stop:20177 length:858 start_codon:yes stop_codon:yes gene_type:complete